MEDADIIDLYKQGRTIGYIVKKYFNYKNRNIRKNHYENGNFVVTQKNISKLECRKHVEQVILNYLNIMKLCNG